MEDEIKKGNVLIAEAIGCERTEIEEYWHHPTLGPMRLLKFHEDWEWLMDCIAVLQQKGYVIQLNSPYTKKSIWKDVVSCLTQ